MTQAVFGQVLTAMVTPFANDGGLDENAVVLLVRRLLATGSDGIVVCGTTGESPTLSFEEKLRLFQLVRGASTGGATVVAGTGSNDTAASIQLTRAAAEIGVDGILLAAPAYNKPSQEGLYRHFKAVADAVPRVPCCVYNVPGRTSVNVEAGTTIRLARDIRNIAAVKEASGNLIQCTEIAARAPKGFTIYSGDDGLTLPMLAVGGMGVVSVTSHIVGEDIKAMHAAFFSGDTLCAAELNGKMLPIVKALFQPTTPSPAPLKAALNMLGFPVGGLRLPLVEATDQEMAIVRAALMEYGLLALANLSAVVQTV